MSVQYTACGKASFVRFAVPLFLAIGLSINIQAIAGRFNYLPLHHFVPADATISMSRGGFIHFMNGTTGSNFKARATTTFGWPDVRETPFIKSTNRFSRHAVLM